MKKILVTTLVACALVSSALAQGVVTMNASGVNQPIRYTSDGTTITKVPGSTTGQIATIAGYGTVNVALYSAPVGTQISLVGGVPDLSAWRIQTSPLIQIIQPSAGNIVSTGVTLGSGTAGSDVQLIVAGWTGPAATFAAAAGQAGPTLLGWSGDTRYAAAGVGAAGWQQATGTDTSPAFIVKGATAFNGLVLAPIPEPSTFALAGLGAAALLIFRRRK